MVEAMENAALYDLMFLKKSENVEDGLLVRDLRMFWHDFVQLSLRPSVRMRVSRASLTPSTLRSNTCFRKSGGD